MGKILFLPILICLAGFLAQPAVAGSLIVPERIPTSDRAEAAWERRAPFLEHQLEAKGLMLGAPIFIRVFKASRELEVHIQGPSGFQHFKTYRICNMSGDLGPKLHRGDEQAPEGFYTVNADWLNPNSRYHLAFNIGYPNSLDHSLGRTGSSIMVHGGCSSRGCFAMTDTRMEEIYTLAKAALRHSQESFQVHVFPFRMTRENMQKHRDSPWYDFWLNLRRGHEYFERHNKPPLVSVRNGLYRFE